MPLKKAPHLFFVFFIIILLGAGYSYFFVVSPSFVKKPALEKPALATDIEEGHPAIFGQEHVVYLLNELDAYMLHNDPITGEPAKIEVAAEEAIYSFEIIGNRIVENYEGIPDIRIVAKKAALIHIFMSDDQRKAILDGFSSGSLAIEIISDEKTLALKGYKAIYDKISAGMGDLTGDVVRLDAKKAKVNISLMAALCLMIIAGMIIEKKSNYP